MVNTRDAVSLFIRRMLEPMGNPHNFTTRLARRRHRATLELGGAPRGGIGQVELLGLILGQSKCDPCVVGPVIRHERH